MDMKNLDSRLLIICICILTIVIVAGLSLSTKSKSITYAHYKSTELGLEFDYPTGWSVEPKTENSEDYIIHIIPPVNERIEDPRSAGNTILLVSKKYLSIDPNYDESYGGDGVPVWNHFLAAKDQINNKDDEYLNSRTLFYHSNNQVNGRMGGIYVARGKQMIGVWQSVCQNNKYESVADYISSCKDIFKRILDSIEFIPTLP